MSKTEFTKPLLVKGNIYLVDRESTFDLDRQAYDPNYKTYIYGLTEGQKPGFINDIICNGKNSNPASWANYPTPPTNAPNAVTEGNNGQFEISGQAKKVKAKTVQYNPGNMTQYTVGYETTLPSVSICCTGKILSHIS